MEDILTVENLIIAIVALGLFCILWYWIITNAVKDGVLNAWEKIQQQEKEKKATSMKEEPLTAEQKLLKEKYEKGEISIEEYKNQWNK